MHAQNITVLGIHLIFATEAEPQRIERARELVEKRFSEIIKNTRQLNKEKLLALLALSLADDLISHEESKDDIATRLHQLLDSIGK